MGAFGDMDKPEIDNKPDTLPDAKIDTKQIDTGKFNPELRAQLKALKNTYTTTASELLLYFPRYSEPFRIELDDTITLGRTDVEANIYPTIDLNPYQGGQLGVSRFHAEIKIVSGRFHIKDMGSRNGTKINGQKIAPFTLVPFNKGDEIRLGHFVMVVG
jgi:pSer/pThr/pTyr-binding forkhead associated (FHA) protein